MSLKFYFVNHFVRIHFFHVLAFAIWAIGILPNRIKKENKNVKTYSVISTNQIIEVIAGSDNEKFKTIR